MIALRPHDSLLRVERARHLAWLEKWDEALSVYGAVVRDLTDPEDAFVENASILLIKGDVASYRRWAAQIDEKLGGQTGPFAGSMLVRGCGLCPDSPIEPSRLVAWAEQSLAKQPRDRRMLYCLGLALLRTGRYSEAVTRFQSSIDAGEDSARVWYGLALAQFRQGNVVESIRWFQRADDWTARQKAECVDRTTQLSPTIYITDWLETLVLGLEAESLFKGRRLGGVVLVDRTAIAGQECRIPNEAVKLRNDAPGASRDSMEIVVPFRSRSPFADGVIRPDEFGPPLEVDFSGDANPGRLFKSSKPVTDPRDLSADLYLAYTKTDLFIAVRVHDDKLVSSPTKDLTRGDSVEIYIDGDRQRGDFDKPSPGNDRANSEGFQLAADVSRRRLANGLKLADYSVVVARCEGGYVTEYRIPLESIDIDDGAERKPPGPGSTLRFNLAIVDNDAPADRQDRYAMLWSNDTSSSPYQQGEPTWAVDLYLARPVSYELVDGPRGATLDRDTGVFAWTSPTQPQTANVTIRARELEKPDLTASASFTITTTSK
jgi:Tetratricopeptide repeat/Carbohydrate family 9 binding domain-like/Putative Ig domain